jgi:hypothetical protein
LDNGPGCGLVDDVAEADGSVGDEATSGESVAADGALTPEVAGSEPPDDSPAAPCVLAVAPGAKSSLFVVAERSSDCTASSEGVGALDSGSVACLG